MPVALFAGQVDQHREPGRALNDGADRRAFQPDQQVTFLVPRHRAVLGLGRAFAHHHLRGHVDPGFALGPAPRDS
jgi:hypothetical protein